MKVKFDRSMDSEKDLSKKSHLNRDLMNNSHLGKEKKEISGRLHAVETLDFTSELPTRVASPSVPSCGASA